jgi:Family of unknown function (DUF6418)
MISVSERIAVVMSGLSFFAFLFYLLNRRPVIFLSFFFIIFTLAWRMSATMFIDLQGPVYSSQLVRDIGPGTATVVHSIAYIVSLLPFLFFFRSAAVEQWCANADQTRTIPRVLTLSDATLILSLVFFALLYLDLARHGPIPLFNRIERYDYAGGLMHRWFSAYSNFLAFWFGLMIAATYIRERRLETRMIGLLCLMLVYAFLTGSRFSAFYRQCAFFLMPWAAVIALWQRKSANSNFWIGRIFVSRRFRFIVINFAIVLTALVSFALYNNLTNVRGYAGGEIWRQFLDRVLIQPSEIGWASFERVFRNGQTEPSLAFNFLFQHPIDLNRNTTIQYLMFATIGEPRTTDHILHGFQLAGGFPEIFFELFGPYLAWPFLLGVGCIAAGLSAYVVRGTLLGNYASAFLSLYVLFGFYVMYIGGMLNFVTPWTYWAKVTLLVVVLLAEHRLADKGLSLLPWNLFAIPQSKI